MRGAANNFLAEFVDRTVLAASMVIVSMETAIPRELAYIAREYVKAVGDKELGNEGRRICSVKLYYDRVPWLASHMAQGSA
jgi:hypothetical protein